MWSAWSADTFKPFLHRVVDCACVACESGTYVPEFLPGFHIPRLFSACPIHVWQAAWLPVVLDTQGPESVKMSLEITSCVRPWSLSNLHTLHPEARTPHSTLSPGTHTYTHIHTNTINHQEHRTQHNTTRHGITRRITPTTPDHIWGTKTCPVCSPVEVPRSSHQPR